MSKEGITLTAILVAIVGAMVGLFVLANRGETSGALPTGDKQALVRPDSHKLGTGAVQLVEYGDFQCPACGSAHPGVKQLMSEYKDKVTFVFRNFPLTNIHDNALAAANAAEAAGAQGKYWEMNDKIYESQKEWERLSDPTAKFVEYAQSLGLDGNKVRDAIRNQTFKTVINQDFADGTAQDVNSTPTFFLNGTKRSGLNTYGTLKAAVDEELVKTALPTAN